MNKSGSDASADHVSTGLGRLSSVVSSVAANPKQATTGSPDLTRMTLLMNGLGLEVQMSS